MKRETRIITCIMTLILAAFWICPAETSDLTTAPENEKYERTFATRDFRMNRDAIKYEAPANGLYKISPRQANSLIRSYFPIPENEQTHAEWSITATLVGSDGPAGGVGFWNADRGYVLYVFPDGKGAFRYYEGKKATYTSNIRILNFSYPADLSMWRDSNGNVIAKVNGIVVAARIFDVDLKNPAMEPVTSVSFVTHSSATKSDASAVYEKIHVEGWGGKAQIEL